MNPHALGSRDDCVTCAGSKPIWYVEIVRDDGSHVDRRLGPFPKHKAEKVENGAIINLDHDRYTTRIVKGDS
jgi:hypothetical protein